MIDIAFSLQPQYDCEIQQVIEFLHEAGFSAVSPVFSNELPLELIATQLQKHGMAFQSLHAPHKGIAKLWEPKEWDAPKSNIIGCIDACYRFGIPIAVVHCWQGLEYTFPDEPLDFSAFDYITDYAEKRNVSIAFENLEGEEYLQALFARYQDRSHIGFCWDSGHDHCYPHKLNFLQSFGHRLIMTHINDNLGLRDPNGVPTGKDDLHFLPYDGNICWDTAIAGLKGLPKQKLLNFELKKRSLSASIAPKDIIYAELSTEEFIRLAGERARKIADLYERIIAE